MRGEKMGYQSMIFRGVGSPPHARGKGIQGVLKGADGGITPACAGKSRSPCSRPRRTWDHPRMRGEKHTKAAIHYGRRGSPPHARGKDRHTM